MHIDRIVAFVLGGVAAVAALLLVGTWEPHSRQQVTAKAAEDKERAHAEQIRRLEAQVIAVRNEARLAAEEEFRKAGVRVPSRSEREEVGQGRPDHPVDPAPIPFTPQPGFDALFQKAQALEKRGQDADAVRMYRRAARAGSGKAALRLGSIYDRGIPGVPRDYQESLMWHEAARQLGETVPPSGTAARQ